ncbi:UNVERIFIED_CONTAM: hypothetical protein HHA_311070 [Hammondia hammondi]|eukprot:XP_008885895.1 hypothetical protein HHA_311070 [Hammondia hammondi]
MQNEALARGSLPCPPRHKPAGFATCEGAAQEDLAAPDSTGCSQASVSTLSTTAATTASPMTDHLGNLCASGVSFSPPPSRPFLRVDGSSSVPAGSLSAAPGCVEGCASGVASPVTQRLLFPPFSASRLPSREGATCASAAGEPGAAAGKVSEEGGACHFEPRERGGLLTPVPPLPEPPAFAVVQANRMSQERPFPFYPPGEGGRRDLVAAPPCQASTSAFLPFADRPGLVQMAGEVCVQPTFPPARLPLATPNRPAEVGEESAHVTQATHAGPSSTAEGDGAAVAVLAEGRQAGRLQASLGAAVCHPPQPGFQPPGPPPHLPGQTTRGSCSFSSFSSFAMPRPDPSAGARGEGRGEQEDLGSGVRTPSSVLRSSSRASSGLATLRSSSVALGGVQGCAPSAAFQEVGCLRHAPCLSPALAVGSKAVASTPFPKGAAPGVAGPGSAYPPSASLHPTTSGSCGPQPAQGASSASAPASMASGTPPLFVPVSAPFSSACTSGSDQAGSCGFPPSTTSRSASGHPPGVSSSFGLYPPGYLSKLSSSAAANPLPPHLLLAHPPGSDATVPSSASGASLAQPAAPAPPFLPPPSFSATLAPPTLPAPSPASSAHAPHALRAQFPPAPLQNSPPAGPPSLPAVAARPGGCTPGGPEHAASPYPPASSALGTPGPATALATSLHVGSNLAAVWSALCSAGLNPGCDLWHAKQVLCQRESRPLRLSRFEMVEAYAKSTLCLSCDSMEHKITNCPFGEFVCPNCHRSSHRGEHCPLPCRFCFECHSGISVNECIRRTVRQPLERLLGVKMPLDAALCRASGSSPFASSGGDGGRPNGRWTVDDLSLHVADRPNTAHGRSVYVSNMVPGTTKEALRTAINLLLEHGCVLSVEMRERSNLQPYAFVELSTLQAAYELVQQKKTALVIRDQQLKVQFKKIGLTCTSAARLRLTSDASHMGLEEDAGHAKPGVSGVCTPESGRDGATSEASVERDRAQLAHLLLQSTEPFLPTGQSVHEVCRLVAVKLAKDYGLSSPLLLDAVPSAFFPRGPGAAHALPYFHLHNSLNAAHPQAFASSLAREETPGEDPLGRAPRGSVGSLGAQPRSEFGEKQGPFPSDSPFSSAASLSSFSSSAGAHGAQRGSEQAGRQSVPLSLNGGSGRGSLTHLRAGQEQVPESSASSTAFASPSSFSMRLLHQGAVPPGTDLQAAGERHACGLSSALSGVRTPPERSANAHFPSSGHRLERGTGEAGGAETQGRSEMSLSDSMERQSSRADMAGQSLGVPRPSREGPSRFWSPDDGGALCLSDLETEKQRVHEGDSLGPRAVAGYPYPPFRTKGHDREEETRRRFEAEFPPAHLGAALAEGSNRHQLAGHADRGDTQPERREALGSLLGRDADRRREGARQDQREGNGESLSKGYGEAQGKCGDECETAGGSLSRTRYACDGVESPQSSTSRHDVDGGRLAVAAKNGASKAGLTEHEFLSLKGCIDGNFALQVGSGVSGSSWGRIEERALEGDAPLSSFASALSALPSAPSTSGVTPAGDPPHVGGDAASEAPSRQMYVHPPPGVAPLSVHPKEFADACERQGEQERGMSAKEGLQEFSTGDRPAAFQARVAPGCAESVARGPGLQPPGLYPLFGRHEVGHPQRRGASCEGRTSGFDVQDLSRQRTSSFFSSLFSFSENEGSGLAEERARRMETTETVAGLPGLADDGRQEAQREKRGDEKSQHTHGSRQRGKGEAEIPRCGDPDAEIAREEGGTSRSSLLLSSSAGSTLSSASGGAGPTPGTANDTPLSFVSSSSSSSASSLSSSLASSLSSGPILTASSPPSGGGRTPQHDADGLAAFSGVMTPRRLSEDPAVALAPEPSQPQPVSFLSSWGVWMTRSRESDPSPVDSTIYANDENLCDSTRHLSSTLSSLSSSFSSFSSPLSASHASHTSAGLLSAPDDGAQRAPLTNDGALSGGGSRGDGEAGASEGPRQADRGRPCLLHEASRQILSAPTRACAPQAGPRAWEEENKRETRDDTAGDAGRDVRREGDARLFRFPFLARSEAEAAADFAASGPSCGVSPFNSERGALARGSSLTLTLSLSTRSTEEEDEGREPERRTKLKTGEKTWMRNSSAQEASETEVDANSTFVALSQTFAKSREERFRHEEEGEDGNSLKTGGTLDAATACTVSPSLPSASTACPRKQVESAHAEGQSRSLRFCLATAETLAARDEEASPFFFFPLSQTPVEAPASTARDVSGLLEGKEARAGRAEATARNGEKFEVERGTCWPGEGRGASAASLLLRSFANPTEKPETLPVSSSSLFLAGREGTCSLLLSSARGAEARKLGAPEKSCEREDAPLSPEGDDHPTLSHLAAHQQGLPPLVGAGLDSSLGVSFPPLLSPSSPVLGCQQTGEQATSSPEEKAARCGSGRTAEGQAAARRGQQRGEETPRNGGEHSGEAAAQRASFSSQVTTASEKDKRGCLRDDGGRVHRGEGRDEASQKVERRREGDAMPGDEDTKGEERRERGEAREAERAGNFSTEREEKFQDVEERPASSGWPTQSSCSLREREEAALSVDFASASGKGAPWRREQGKDSPRGSVAGKKGKTASDENAFMLFTRQERERERLVCAEDERQRVTTELDRESEAEGERLRTEVAPENATVPNDTESTGSSPEGGCQVSEDAKAKKCNARTGSGCTSSIATVGTKTGKETLEARRCLSRSFAGGDVSRDTDFQSLRQKAGTNKQIKSEKKCLPRCVSLVADAPKATAGEQLPDETRNLREEPTLEKARETNETRREEAVGQSRAQAGGAEGRRIEREETLDRGEEKMLLCEEEATGEWRRNERQKAEGQKREADDGLGESNGKDTSKEKEPGRVKTVDFSGDHASNVDVESLLERIDGITRQLPPSVIDAVLSSLASARTPAER